VTNIISHQIHQFVKRVEKVQGRAARLTSHLPDISKRLLAQALGQRSPHGNLDPHLQFLLAFRALRGGADLVGDDPVKSRRHFRREMAALTGKPTPVAKVRDFDILVRSGQIAVRHYQPIVPVSHKEKLPLLVFFHGGGFVVGDLDTHDEPCRLLCQYGQMHVLSVDYRLAPEHPAPAAVEDCLDALKWAYQHATELNVDPKKITVGGDSAGGNLSAAVSQLARGESFAPKAQLLIYPVVDLLNDYPTYADYGTGLFLLKSDMDRAKLALLSGSGVAKDDPRVSPIFGDLSGLAAALVVTAEFDTLRDEGEHYAVKLSEAGTRCVAYRVERQGHGFINLAVVNPGAFKATVKMARDFRRLLDRL